MSRYGLRHTTLGVGQLWTLCVGASAPLVVLSGGIVATHAATGLVALPVVFVMVGLVLVPLLVPLVTASRHIGNAAPMYALLAQGLGPVWGTAGAAVGLLTYTCIGASLLGLVGATGEGLSDVTWMVWAVVAWLVVMVIGVRSVRVGAWVVGAIVAAQVGLLLWYDVAALSSGAGSVWTGRPGLDLVARPDVVVTAMVFLFAAFIGIETAPTYAEEARSRWSAGRATWWALGGVTVLYAVSAWAYVKVADGRDPAVWMADNTSILIYPLWIVLLVWAMLTSLVAFHQVAARQIFALSREAVLPGRLAAVSSGGGDGAPIGGSLAYSAVGLTLIALAWVFGVAPMDMFVFLSTVAATGLVVLLTVCSLAAWRYLGRRPEAVEMSVWVRRVWPAAGMGVGVVLVVVMVTNLGSLLDGVAGTLTLLPALLVLGAAVAGGVWGVRLWRYRYDVYVGVGWGRPDPLAQLDRNLPEV